MDKTTDYGSVDTSSNTAEFGVFYSVKFFEKNEYKRKRGRGGTIKKGGNGGL